MSQDDYKLWTGQDASSYTSAEWTKLVGVASKRLARFLCLEKLPDDPSMPEELEELLANFMAAVLNRRGGQTGIKSKNIRNFRVEFSTSNAANAYAAIYEEFEDTIEAFSACGATIKVESSARHCCDGRL